MWRAAARLKPLRRHAPRAPELPRCLEPCAHGADVPYCLGRDVELLRQPRRHAVSAVLVLSCNKDCLSDVSSDGAHCTRAWGAQRACSPKAVVGSDHCSMISCAVRCWLHGHRALCQQLRISLEETCRTEPWCTASWNVPINSACCKLHKLWAHSILSSAGSIVVSGVSVRFQWWSSDCKACFWNDQHLEIYWNTRDQGSRVISSQLSIWQLTKKSFPYASNDSILRRL